MPEPELTVWIEAIDVETCWQLIGRRHFGRLGFVTDDGPVVIPVNHLVEGHSIIVRTGRSSMLDAARHGATVAFEVDESDDDSETGWSVLVKGPAHEITERSELADLRAAPLHPWAPGPRDHWIRITSVSVTGRAISRRRDTAGGHFLPYMPPD